MSVLFQFKGKVKDTEGLESKDSHSPVFEAIASTAALDRDREVLLPRGVMIDNFMKNPVMLHIHDYRQLPVGKVLEIGIEKKEVSFKFQFADTDTGRELRYLYDNDFMNAFSVGFYPRAAKMITDEDGEKVKLPVADDTEEVVDLSKYETRPRAVIHKWELLEISPVPVPSNPEALLRRSADLVVRKYHDQPALAAHAKSALDADVTSLLDMISKFTDETDSFEVRGPVRSHTTPTDFEAAWDGQKARATLARDASSDGSGKKETIDFAKFAQGFAWFDSAAADTLGAYKLPHHVARDGSIVAIFRGVTAAMGALLGARGGADIPTEDRQAVYDHLARHYRDADREAPEFREVGEYDDEALKAIEDGEWEDYKARSGPGGVGNHTHEFEAGAGGRTGPGGPDNHTHAAPNGAARSGSTNGHTHALPGNTRDAPEVCDPTVGEDENGKPQHTCPDGMRLDPNTGQCVRRTVSGIDEKDTEDANDDETNSGDRSLDLAKVIKRVDDLETELDVRLSILGDLIEEVTAAIRTIKKSADGDDDTAADGGKGNQPTGDEDNVMEFKVPDDLTQSLDKLTGTGD